MRKAISGFTMIEILVVVAVIGILSTIGIVAFTKVQTDSRDSQRSSRVTVISEALEKYYQQNGEYPSCTAMKQDADVVKSDVLKGIDTTVLKTPTDNTSTNGNSITTCDNLLSGPGSDVFAYVGDGSTTCRSGNACLSYSLKYREEATGEIVSVDSRHSASIATSGAPTLSVASTSFSQISLTWTGVPNAVNYTVERMSNAACTTTSGTASGISGTSYSSTGLTAGTTYRYRVKAVDDNGIGGAWSNCVTATTPALTGIGLVATANSNSQITLTWNYDSLASNGYNIYWSTNNSSNCTPVSGQAIAIPKATTTRVVTGLSTGVKYYFCGQSVAGSTYGPWSYADAVTFVPAPTSITATTDSATQITASWANVSVANTYTLDYSTTSSFTPATTNSIDGITTTSRAVTGLNQGITYYFRVFALVSTTSSDPSPSALSTTTVNTPGSPGMTASQPGAIRTCAAGAWVVTPAQCPNNYYATGRVTSTSCPAGTSPRYQLSVRYNSPTTSYATSSSGTTTAQWYFQAARSGYYTLWKGRYFCQGPNASSSWGAWSGEVRT